SVLEAFASGMPVVSTNAGGVPSILRHGVDGLLVRENADDEMAARVLDLLRDPSFARALADSAHRTLAAYDWPVVREAWLRAYRHVAGRRHDQLAAPVPAAPSNPA